MARTKRMDDEWTEVTPDNLEICNDFPAQTNDGIIHLDVLIARTPDSWGQKVPGYVRRDSKTGHFVDIAEVGVFSPPEYELLNPSPHFHWHLKNYGVGLPSNAFVASTGYPSGNFYIGIVHEKGSWLPGVVNDEVLFVAVDGEFKEYKAFQLLCKRI